MKKLLCILSALIVLFLSACNNVEKTSSNEKVDTSEDVSSISSQSPSSEILLLPLPSENTEFSYLSGAGAWRTVLTLNKDGSFSGFYLDSEMGEFGDDYPNGSAYTSTFSGKFEVIEKINDYSYKMSLSNLETEIPVGEEWIEDEIRYIATLPNGLYNQLSGQLSSEFIFYLPSTPINSLSEEFLSWWPYRYSESSDSITTLSCYGILNVETNDGLFSGN